MSLFKIDNYMFLFTRRRKRVCVASTLLASLLFIAYQLLFFYMVTNKSFIEHPTISSLTDTLVRGSHIKEGSFYVPLDGKFTCFKSGEVIEFRKVNDDYCDCADSTDEPGTNACPDGVFYCPKTSSNKKYPKMIPSSKVNDGICDCCDGAEEYGNNDVLHDFQRSLQVKMGHFLVPCPNLC